MNNKEDLLLREKIESVGTLQGGIVYGKEEAWEKLQARMDKKPARILPWRGILAAAAILLLIAGIILYRFMQPITTSPKQEFTQEHTQPANNITHNELTSPAPIASIAATAQPVEINTTISKQHVPALTPIAGYTDMAIIQNRTELRPMPAGDTCLLTELTPMPVYNPSLLFATAKPKMKVLHINELDNPAVAEQEALASNDEWLPPSANPAKMNTIHINDVTRQDEQDRLAPRKNKTSIGNITFFKKPSPYQMDMTSESQDHGHGLFRINTSTQN